MCNCRITINGVIQPSTILEVYVLLIFSGVDEVDMHNCNDSCSFVNCCSFVLTSHVIKHSVGCVEQQFVYCFVVEKNVSDK